MLSVIDSRRVLKDSNLLYCPPGCFGYETVGTTYMCSFHRIVIPNWIIGRMLALGLVLGLPACGGGGGSQGPPPQPDFELAVTPTTQSVSAGSSATVSLSATALNGFSSQVSVQASGVPAGVSVSPGPITLQPGTPQQVTLTATANAPGSNGTVTFTGRSGSLTHASGLNLTVNGSGGGLPVRTGYLRTDATTEYFLYINQHWIVYDPGTARYFVTDPWTNQVVVIDAVSLSKIGTIGVPGAFGIDETPDHSTLYVGTQIGDVYTLDPVAMKVKSRYLASQIGPYGYPSSVALVLSDGRLALIGPYNGIDLTDGIAIWNPADNSIIMYGSGGQAFPCGASQGPISGFTLSADRTQILLGIGEICAIDASTGNGTYGASGLEGVAYSHIAVTPDGKYLVLPNFLLTLNPSVADIVDAKTFNIVAQFSVLGDVSSASGFFISADSKTAFMPTDSIIYAYDIATQQLKGWIPNIFLPPTSGGMVFGPLDSPYLLATDGTGLYAGPMEEGIGFIDVSALQTGPIGTEFSNSYLSPTTGPTAGGTATQWSAQTPVGSLESVYFGSKQATSISYQAGFVHATTPSESPGPANVYTFTTDGGMQLVPDGFSYGPTILEVTPNMATVEAGGTGYIYGYGFGPTDSNAIPSALTVTVGGATVQITAYSANAYSLLSPPYLLQSIAYTIPPGVSGASSDVTVTTSSGSATAAGSLTYLPPIQQYSIAGSELAQGIYDPYTDLYYFTDTNQIQVFSRTQGKWLSPIPIPAPKGTTQRLWGIAISPDGTKMAVSDLNAGAIYVLDPTNPASVNTFIVGPQGGIVVNPCGLAISDAGNVYYMVEVLGVTGADQFFKLNTTTGTILDYHINGPGYGANDAYLRNAISSDNARVYYNEEGQVFNIDTATDTIFYTFIDPSCCYGNYELALSSNETRFTATFYIYDSDLNAESTYAMNDREILNILYVYGAKLSPDGRLLFQPSTNGIDAFDGNLGNLRDRISLPVSLSLNYDAVVADGRDNVFVAITGTTGNGIAVVDLTSLTEPPPLADISRFDAQPHQLSKFARHWRARRQRPLREQELTFRLPIRAVPHATRNVLRNSR